MNTDLGSRFSVLGSRLSDLGSRISDLASSDLRPSCRSPKGGPCEQHDDPGWMCPRRRRHRLFRHSWRRCCVRAPDRYHATPRLRPRNRAAKVSRNSPPRKDVIPGWQPFPDRQRHRDPDVRPGSVPQRRPRHPRPARVRATSSSSPSRRHPRARRFAATFTRTVRYSGPNRDAPGSPAVADADADDPPANTRIRIPNPTAVANAPARCPWQRIPHAATVTHTPALRPTPTLRDSPGRYSSYGMDASKSMAMCPASIRR